MHIVSLFVGFLRNANGANGADNANNTDSANNADNANGTDNANDADNAEYRGESKRSAVGL